MSPEALATTIMMIFTLVAGSAEGISDQLPTSRHNDRNRRLRSYAPYALERSQRDLLASSGHRLVKTKHLCGEEHAECLKPCQDECMPINGHCCKLPKCVRQFCMDNPHAKVAHTRRCVCKCKDCPETVQHF